MPGCFHVMGSLLQVLSVYVLAHLVSLSCFVYLFFIEIIFHFVFCNSLASMCASWGFLVDKIFGALSKN